MPDSVLREQAIPLAKLALTRRSGTEALHAGGTPLNATVLDFWRWAFSDLVDNTTRGVLAEFIVALALGTVDRGVREGWSPYDLTTPDGIRVEVKSAAYLQSWGQKRHSAIEFGVTATQAFDDEHNTYDSERRRQADVYVFALLHHKDKQTVDPLNLDQWNFFVLPTHVLNTHVPTQKNVTLRRLQQLNPIETTFVGISDAVHQAYLSGG